MAADELEAAVSRWAADEEAREVARVRAAARRLVDEAAEEQDLPGVLRHLAGRGRPARLATGPGREHRGLVRVVGDDFVGLATERAWGLVALRAVTTVRLEDAGGTGRWALGPDWSEAPPARLADAVERLAGEDLPVRVHAMGDQVGLVGELRLVGNDHLRLACDPDRPFRAAGTIYVALASLAELWLLRSG